MGAKSSKPASGVIVTLDALGTLYRFRESVARQYINIAKQCGLKTQVDEKALQTSFRQAFKKHNATYPNYGKGQLASPEIWWDGLVTQTFLPVVQDEKLPPHLGHSMYDHFTSGSAYELYPDVKPFLTSMNKYRGQDVKHDGPTIFLGVITNSDPRVGRVLQSLGIRVGFSQDLLSDRDKSRIAKAGHEIAEEVINTGRLPGPYCDIYDTTNDFDFLVTSYESGFEKPNSEIFAHARGYAELLVLSRIGHGSPNSGGLPSMRESITQFSDRVRNMTWIHIGDDYIKDYEGAKSSGIEGLYLARSERKDEDRKKNAGTVTSLEEAAEVISIMAQQNLLP